MTRHVTSAIFAGLITAISAWGLFAQIGFVTPMRRLAAVASLPAVPGIIVAALVGLGHGPDGWPHHRDPALYVFTFLIWWVVLDLGQRWWQRRRRASFKTMHSGDENAPDKRVR
jgi:hypothetical protein